MGAGSWGTALAVLLARNGQPTYLWGHDQAHIASLRETRRNTRFLPGIVLPEAVMPITALPPAGIRDVVVAVPVNALREVTRDVLAKVSGTLRIALACKGIEASTHKLGHETVEEVLGMNTVTALVSGPSFATEVAAGLPTALTVASRNEPFARDLVQRLHNRSFRAYISDDLTGVAIGGAVKNVLAIAAGVGDGLGFGANTRAALITRGLAEMVRLGLALGGQRATLTGLAGIGDLVLTCTDDQSRNRRLGLMLGRGVSLAEAVRRIGQVVEGVRTAYEVLSLARKHAIEMPISEQVVRVVAGECEPREAVQTLLAREPRQEIECS
ncbi:MAG: Glycerol-3-phosphate dehydrogenase [NAD(P)+] [Chromatiales bacterium USCg_Taylor]|nr:MAG: Glycerol-3-phosphate dehydrogenase [NAD(P)+] [Chromatiales bacterium USCg_Taylor]